MKMTRSMIGFLLILLASCASDSDSGGEIQNTGRKTMNERMNETHGYEKDENGDWVSQSDKRSSFDGSGAPGGIQGNVGKKTYQTGELNQRSWWGNKKYGQKQYAGNTKNTTLGKSSNLGRKGAREAGNSSGMSGNYGTGSLTGKSAREGGGNSMSNQRFSGEGKRNQELDWKEQRSLSLKESTGILGR